MNNCLRSIFYGLLTSVFSLSATAQTHDVVFSEIYYEPNSSSPLPNSEYIEIYNRSAAALDLTGWVVSDGNTDGLMPHFILHPQSYIVLYKERDSALFAGINSIGTNLPSLNNDVGDHLQLFDSLGTLIDAVDFNDDYYHDTNKDDGGWSIERIDNDFTCANEFNWIASSSVLHGTPGSTNSVQDVFTDDVAPLVKSVFPSDSFSVQVVFNEALSGGYLDTWNYEIKSESGITMVPHTIFSTTSGDSIQLQLPQALGWGVYFLKVSNAVSDCPGNGYEGPEIPFGFPEEAMPGDVVINELLFNPYSGGNDFLELYNSSSKIIDLKGWIIQEADFADSLSIRDDCVLPSSKLIFPDEFLALTNDIKKVSGFYYSQSMHLFQAPSFPDFNSDNGRVAILNSNGELIDAFNYSEDMHFNMLEDVKGVSLERLSTNETSHDKFNWHSAAATAGFATPGYENSQVAGMNFSGKVSLEKELFSPDNDGYDDLLIIHYESEKAGVRLSAIIYNHEGYAVRTLLAGASIGNSGLVTWDGVGNNGSVPACGPYVLVMSFFDEDGNEEVIKKAIYLWKVEHAK